MLLLTDSTASLDTNCTNLCMQDVVFLGNTVTDPDFYYLNCSLAANLFCPVVGGKVNKDPAPRLCHCLFLSSQLR
jgi:hypothetical protein